jgi:hypothetical protein
MALPDFAIIGAMKCGTTTLAAQLAAQDGVFVTTPKEPEFFSEDANHARGTAWYEALYHDAAPGDLRGEGSTGLTKSLEHPRAAERLHAGSPDARLIYLMRDPVERAISHYIHEWSQGVVTGDLDAALARHPEIIAYSRYDEQLVPWRRLFGAKAVLCMRMEDMQADPQAALDRVAAHLGRPGAFAWVEDLGPQNVSAERIRKFPGYDLLVAHPAAAALRRALVPRGLRDAVKARLRMRKRPEPTLEARARLAEAVAGGAAEWLAAAAPPRATA